VTIAPARDALEDRLLAAPSVPALLAVAVEQHGPRTAVIDSRDGTTLDYAGFAAAVRGTARDLHALGVRPGDRVALAMLNGWEYAVVYYATLTLGGVAVLVNTRLAAPEIAYVLQDSGASLAVTEAGLLDRMPGGVPVVLATEVVTREDAPGWPTVERTPADAANLLYTSGTTGRPKGAIQTHGNLVFNAGSNRRLLGTGVGDRMLIAAPFFHATGLNSQLVGSLSGGATVVIQPSFQRAETLRLLAEHRITVFAGVTTMLQLLVMDPGFSARDLSELRLFVLGGAPVQESVLDLAAEHLPQTVLGNAWGLTEATSIVTYVDGADFQGHPTSVGRPAPGVEVRIWDDGAAAFADAPDAVGELCVRGPVVTAGYWGKPEATAGAFLDGWLHTGDIGSLDAEGYVRVLDRTKDMIIRGGENVYSLEVENAISSHPDVAMVAVFGRPDPIFDERVCAALTLREGATTTEDELRAWTAESVADYKVPVVWEFLPEMPLGPTGKILKQALR
jgi:acyl-CoA synthetase (AMP-forming)/AMP-acid ligase II